MYSKAGRASSEFFHILRQGNDILESPSRILKTTLSPSSSSSKDKLSEMVAKKFGQNGALKDLAGILDTEDSALKRNETSKSPTRSTKEAKKFEPFAQMVSRETREKNTYS